MAGEPCGTSAGALCRGALPSCHCTGLARTSVFAQWEPTASDWMNHAPTVTFCTPCIMDVVANPVHHLGRDPGQPLSFGQHRNEIVRELASQPRLHSRRPKAPSNGSPCQPGVAAFPKRSIAGIVQDTLELVPGSTASHHQPPLTTALALGAKLGHRQPGHRCIYGVKNSPCLTWGP